MMSASVTANGKPIAAQLPCTLEQFLVAQQFLPRPVKAALAPMLAAV